MTDQLTEEQIDDFKAAFLSFDRNSDGIIDIKELANVTKYIFGKIPKKRELKRLFKAVDADSKLSRYIKQQNLSMTLMIYLENGAIDFSEFVRMMESAKVMIIEDLKKKFQTVDKDGNGLITEAELKPAMVDDGHKYTDTEIDEMIKKVDMDCDGQLNYREFIRAMTLE